MMLACTTNDSIEGEKVNGPRHVFGVRFQRTYYWVRGDAIYCNEEHWGSNRAGGWESSFISNI